MILLLAPTIIRPEVPSYTPTPPAPRAPVAGPDSGVITVDAGDEHRWRFVDLDRGSIVIPPDTAGWDLMLRRFHIVPSGSAVNLGAVPFESVALPDSGYEPSRFAADTANPATERWYRYSYFSHLLSPRPDIYAFRTRDGGAGKLQFLSYYCPGPTPGCITVRYSYDGGKAAGTGAVPGAISHARHAAAAVAKTPGRRDASR